MTSSLASIPPSAPFLKTLASFLWEKAAHDPAALAAMQVYLPSRRACRSLRTAFLQITKGEAVLLPRLAPLARVDEDAFDFAASAADLDLTEAVTPLRRTMMLMRLISRKDPTLPPQQTVLLADALAHLLDQAAYENLSFDALEKLVPMELAQHWQETLRFLDIITHAWPEILTEEGRLDPAQRQINLIEAQASLWRAAPPATPIIAAGITSFMPAVHNLLATIAALPQGLVVFPSLDLSLDEDAWQKIDESHAQYGLKKILDALALNRQDVTALCAPSLPAREKLITEVLRPAETTDAWRDLATSLPPNAASDLEELTLDTPQEEAEVIALRLRGLLEEKGKTGLVVTPDRALAARIAAALRRWHIEADDSAGQSLTSLPLGGYLLAVLKAAAPTATAIDYLTLLKHPLTGAGLPSADCRAYARRIEMDLWRGLRRTDGLTGAAEFYREKDPTLSAWCTRLAALLAPFHDTSRDPQPLSDRIAAHIDLAESFAATDADDGATRLWRDPAGQAAATFFDAWKTASHDLPPQDAAAYAALCETLLHNVETRPLYGSHDRIDIMGPLEARLHSADLVILAGLNEGTWPSEAEADPWMSRPMQRNFGLPLPERRIGLSAHDFACLASGPHVLLTRAKREGGAPTVPSRFLAQLHAVLQIQNPHQTPQALLTPQEPWQVWAQNLDRPAPTEVHPMLPPRPVPPVALRPRSLHVTEVGTLMRNPYAIYAKHILHLRPLEDIATDPDASDHGTILHKILERYLRAAPVLPDPALLQKIADACFAPFTTVPEVAAFWKPRFATLARWFLATQEKRTATGCRVLALEASGKLDFPDLNFTIDGRADRIDALPDGSLDIIDYKTSRAPDAKALKAGVEPQLALLALMASAGAFAPDAQGSASALSYWILRGDDQGPSIKAATKDPAAFQDYVNAKVRAWIATYDNPAMPYLAMPRSRYALPYDDYAPLSRQAEWGNHA